MQVSVLIVEKLSEQERDAIADVWGRQVIEAALVNAAALRILRETEHIERRQVTVTVEQHQAIVPLTLEEIEREERRNETEKIMRRRQGGKLGSET